MTLMVRLNPDLERRLSQEAARRGLSPAVYVERLIEANVPSFARLQRASARSQHVSDWDREGQSSESPELAGRNIDVVGGIGRVEVDREEAEPAGTGTPAPESI